MKTFDCVVVGAGPAGLSAALFLARADLSVLLVGDHTQASWYDVTVRNFPGLGEKNGKEIALNLLEQAKQKGLEHLPREVVEITKKEAFKIVLDDRQEIGAHYVILSSGLGKQKLGLENEEKLKGKGVHYCVNCDGFFYKDKKVAVIGGGSYAAQEALQLLKLTSTITLFSPEFTYHDAFKEALSAVTQKRAKVKAFKGDAKLTHLVTDDEEEIFDAVFVADGQAGVLAFSTMLGLQVKENALVVDRLQATSVEGCYAAGNCTGGNMQAVISAGEGANAAIEVIKKVKKIEKYVDY